MSTLAHPGRRRAAVAVAATGGFTLIEVLVALAIVAIGMAAVLEAMSSSANTVSYLRDKTLAEWVGLNQIATVRLQLQPQQIPPTGNTTGDMDFAGRSWHWRQEVTATDVKGIERIDVKVRPKEVKAGDDNGWFVTVSGIAGDALQAPNGTTPMWGTGIPGQDQNGGDLPGITNTSPLGPANGRGGVAGQNGSQNGNPAAPNQGSTGNPSQNSGTQPGDSRSAQ